MRKQFAAALFFAVASWPSSLALAQTEPAAEEPVRTCSAVVENNWRAVVPINNRWAARDCRQYAVSMGATSYQLGCIFSDYRGHGGGRQPQRFSWGPLIPISREAWGGDQPVPTCGWQVPPPPR